MLLDLGLTHVRMLIMKAPVGQTLVLPWESWRLLQPPCGISLENAIGSAISSFSGPCYREHTVCYEDLAMRDLALSCYLNMARMDRGNL